MTLRPIGLTGQAFPTFFVEASTCLRAQNSHQFLRFATTTRQPPQRRFAGTLNSKHTRPCAQLRCLSKGFFLSNGAGGSQLSDNDGAILSPRRIAWLQRNNAASTPHSQRRHLFFSSSHRQNASIDKGDELPHRRRRKSNANQAGEDGEIRPDASSRLSTFSSTLPQTSLKRRLAAYLALTKPHLSFLVVLTATTAYGLYPTPSVLELDPSSTQLPTLSTSTLTFLYLSAGTFLASASANTLNMLFEPKYDACMSRTRNRPLVRGLMSKRAALLFAILTGVAGVTALDVGVNPTVAALGAFNLGLYAFVYTPLKRISVLNTWVGAIVGGIPPLMGWTAAAGQLATIGHEGWQDLLFGPGSAGGWLLAAILYAWQFPHFNSLSHNIKDEYKRAGYRMLAWSNPAMN
ncbi:Protoheme IX farnesyltransferase, mitochondrial, partial [Ascosphaera atra]